MGKLCKASAITIPHNYTQREKKYKAGKIRINVNLTWQGEVNVSQMPVEEIKSV